MHLMPRIDSIDDDLEDPHTEFKSNKKQHNFLKKTIIKPENCLPCGSRFVVLFHLYLLKPISYCFVNSFHHSVKFGRSALKCSDCRATCHQECKLLMPLPCVPYVAVPLSADEDTRRTIGEFAPHLSPMIPALVVHCVNQLDERGLDSVGLYAVGGSERKVQELKVTCF
jgi:Rac GTPase-activating protein 1